MGGNEYNYHTATSMFAPLLLPYIGLIINHFKQIAVMLAYLIIINVFNCAINSFLTSCLKETVMLPLLADTSDPNTLQAVLGFFLLWTVLYFIVHAFNYTQTPEWNCRIVTGFHAILVTSLCFYSAFVLGPWPFDYIAQKNTVFHNQIMVISLGYFIFDFLWCLYMDSETLVMRAHHAVSITSFAYSLYYNSCGSEVIAVIGASEFTNPLLQLRWFVKQKGKLKGNVAAVLDFTFFLAFWMSRLVVGTAFHIKVQTNPNLDMFARIGGNAFYIISVVFGVGMLRYIVNRYFLKRRQSDD